MSSGDSSNSNGSERESALLRVSDFCQPISIGTAANSVEDDESWIPPSRRIHVQQICILNESFTPLGKKEDEFSTVYFSHVESFIQWNIMEGTICWLSSHHRQQSSKRVPVLVKVLSKQQSPTCQRQKLLYVPPCVAATIGLYYCSIKYNPTSSDYFILTPIIGTQRDSLPVANEVSLQQIGSIPDGFLPSPHVLKRNEDLYIQQYFHAKPRLVSQSCIIGICIPSRVQSHTNNRHIETMKFYQIVRIVSPSPLQSNPQTNTVSSTSNAYLVTKTTKLLLLSTSVPDFIRLPSIRQARFFYKSIIQNKNEKKHPVFSGKNIIICQTQLNNLVDLMWYSTTMSAKTTFRTRCIHVTAPKIKDTDGNSNSITGTSYPSHDVDIAVNNYINTAAEVIGMRCLSIDGLAAFHYRYMQHQQQHVGGSNNVLAEKILGFQVALKICAQENCILHVANFQSEFFHEEDDEMNREFLYRIQACLEEACNKSTHNFTIVISSTESQQQQHQKMCQLLSAFPSIPLSFTPNEKDLEIFTTDQLLRCHIINDNVKLDSQKISHPLLLGRNEQEILIAFHKCFRQLKPSQHGSIDVLNTLYSILHDMDCEKKNVSTPADHNNNNSQNTIIPKVKWEDIGGLHKVRNEIRNVIEIPLLYPHLFKSNYTKRGGILLWGPPGTGKTLVAKAVATECELPFFSVKGPELLGSYVGESEANVRMVFGAARQHALASCRKAAILFFDELDSLAPRRRIMEGNNSSGSSDVMDRVVATLLGELDQENEPTVVVSSNHSNHDDDRQQQVKVFVIGATNRPDLLDPALLQPGRLDRRVYLGLPSNDEDRIQILKSQMQKFTFDVAVNCDKTAALEQAIRSIIHRIPPNLSGADLSAISSGALIRSLGRKCKEIEIEAMKRVTANAGSVNNLNEKGQYETSLEITIQQVMEEWEDSHTLLTPVVTFDDVIEAAKCVQPSVSLEDKKKYEELDNKFSSS